MKFRLFLSCIVLPLTVGVGAWSGEIGAITLEIGEASGNIGDTAEIVVSLTSTTDSPATVILSLEYDPLKLEPFDEFFEFTVLDFVSGEPLVDGGGNVVTETGAVRLDASVVALGKIVDTEVQLGGVIDILVTGNNASPIPDGPLMTIAFELLSGGAENETLVLDGVATDAGEGFDFFSSASTAAGEAIPISIIDGGIMVGCTAAETPTGLAVGSIRSESVTLTWDAVSDSTAEYRVYRNDVPLVAGATPIGGGWQTETSFVDITATVPEVIGGSGCLGVPMVTVVPHFYWVKSRAVATGCESGFANAPVEGFRGAKKINVDAVSASAMPTSWGGADSLLMGLLVVVFLVLRGGTPFRCRAR
jgi:hypothetical protein